MKGNRLQGKLKPLAQGSSPQKGNISDAELARVTSIPKSTLISWKKTNILNWRNKHYWLLKSFSKEDFNKFNERAKK